MTYSAVLKKLEELRKVRIAYIEANGWVAVKGVEGRWRITITWGTKAEKTVEADLLDAVRYQATKDGELG